MRTLTTATIEHSDKINDLKILPGSISETTCATKISGVKAVQAALKALLGIVRKISNAPDVFNQATGEVPGNA